MFAGYHDSALPFAPIAAFLLGVTDLSVPWETLLLSTVLYVVLPLLAGMATRKALGAERVPAFVARLKPTSVIGLIGTVLLLFALQVVFSRWWLARFRFGPAEWAWRAATYGVRPRMRLAADSP